MQKIMFNDRYGLTQAVLNGHKTMTRRIVPEMVGRVYKKEPDIVWDHKEECFLVFKDNDDLEPIFLYPKYRVGEIVAVAQCYRDIYDLLPDDLGPLRVSNGYLHESCGWTNKMFVLSHVMPHQVRITDIHVERLQDISCMDCVSEGVIKNGPWKPFNYAVPGFSEWFETPQKAFAALIDKVSGKGTWERNPWVFVYSFELVK